MPGKRPALPPAPTTNTSCTPPCTAPAASTRLKATRHVDLGDAAPVMSTWRNDPSYMKLDTYFAEDQKAVPGIAASFGLKKLKPVLVKADMEEGNDYLLTDGKRYYMYNELVGRLWKFKNMSLTQSMVVKLVQSEMFGGDDFVEQLPPGHDAE